MTVNEMHDEQTSTEDDPLYGPSDDALLIALREAGGTESADVEREAADVAAKSADAPAAASKKEAAAEPAKAEPPKAGDETADPNEPKIAAVLRAREKAHKERDEARSYAEQIRHQAQTEAQRMLDEARATAQRTLQEEQLRFRQQFAADPLGTIKQAGIPSQKIIDDVTLENTPEWRAIQEARQRADAAEAKAAVAEKTKTEFEAFKRQVEADKHEAQLAAIEDRFLTLHANAEKAPTLHKLAESIPSVPGIARGRALIIALGHAQGKAWRDAGIEFADSDIAEYLEHQARRGQLGSVGGSSQKVGEDVGNAPKGKANGSRTLSAANGSERRATPKPIDEMTPAEERKALLEELQSVRRTLKTE